MKVSNKEIRRFAQTMQESLHIDLSHCIKIVEMLSNNSKMTDIDHYILANCSAYAVNEVEQCLIDVNSEENIIIGKQIYYTILDGHAKGEKLGELPYINDKFYFPYQ